VIGRLGSGRGRVGTKGRDGDEVVGPDGDPDGVLGALGGNGVCCPAASDVDGCCPGDGVVDAPADVDAGTEGLAGVVLVLLGPLPG
jgi:hypothetical protein